LEQTSEWFGRVTAERREAERSSERRKGESNDSENQCGARSDEITFHNFSLNSGNHSTGVFSNKQLFWRMPPGLDGKNLRGLSEFQSRPIRRNLRAELPANPFAILD
jgi:hypothetical protein